MKLQIIHARARHVALLACLCAVALVTFVPPPIVSADDPLGQDVLISSDGQETALENFAANVTRGYRGTGIPSEHAATAENEIPFVNRVRGMNGIESVIGTDERARVTDTTAFPNRAIASLVMTFPDGDYLCTGWFIGPDVLATAGHCVYDPFQQTFASKIRVYPGRNGDTLPYGSAKSTMLYTNRCWKKTASPECDYGAIKINKPLGNTVGWFGFGYYNADSSLLNKKVNVRGYPGDKPQGTMWTMKGTIEQVTSTRFGYSIDTFGGQSGSPAFGKFKINGVRCKPCGMGIHAYGVGATPFYARNSAVRITEKVFNSFCSWRGGCK